MNYLEWNYHLTKYYFKEEMAGREVILFADEAIINQIGSKYNADINDFINAIKQGLDLTNKRGICQKAYDLYKDWRIKGKKYPPYLAYLILFVLAAGTEADFISNAYYPRLRLLLGEESKSGQYPSFQLMWQLWYDLQTWSIEDRNETVGRFIARVTGERGHVGLPFSQTLITNEERKKLPQFFTDFNFDSTSLPSISTLRSSLLLSTAIQKKTKSLLIQNNEEDKPLIDALLQVIYEELQDWDGTVPNIGRDERESYHALLRICLTYDAVAETVKTNLRFKSNHQFPEEEFQFKFDNSDIILTCKESNPGWSTFLSNQKDNMPLDASNIDWINGETFIDKLTGWKVKTTSSKIHLFMSGKTEGFSGWIETNKLDFNKEYLFAVYEENVEIITNWGKSSCREFEKLPYRGLPERWHLFRIKNVFQSHPDIDLLKLPTFISFRFEGGIKSGKGNYYYDFAPPKIVLEGIKNNEVIKMNGVELKLNDESQLDIPTELWQGTFFKFEVLVDQKVICTRNIKLTEPVLQDSYKPPARDPYGNILEELRDNSVSGAKAYLNPEFVIPPIPFQIPTYLSHHVIFIGKNTGEICDWPNEDLRFHWKPVWAIAKIKRDYWKAYFVGESQDIISTVNVNKNNHNWKKWKRALLQNQIQLPQIEILSFLFKEYQKEAKKL